MFYLERWGRYQNFQIYPLHQATRMNKPDPEAYTDLYWSYNYQIIITLPTGIDHLLMSFDNILQLNVAQLIVP